jgi:hypothetical protein
MILKRFNPNVYKSRTAWQKLGFDIKPEHYGKPAAFVERKGSVFKVYTLDQVAPCQNQKKV